MAVMMTTTGMQPSILMFAGDLVWGADTDTRYYVLVYSNKKSMLYRK